MHEQKRIVVVGGGFGGLNVLKGLRNNRRYHVTLVDVNNYHFFPPLLYQVAMALIEPANIVYPFRRFFQRRPNLRYHMGRAIRVNTERNTIDTDTGSLEYDYLVLAIGTEPRHFGMQNVKKHSWPLKTIDDATNLRNHLLLNVEKAIRCSHAEERKRLLTVVIAGGGPTGVEVAGMMAEMVRKIGPKEYPELKRGDFSIYLVQGSPELLKAMSKKAQDEALHVLTHLGIHVLLDTRVVDYTNGNVVLDKGVPIPTHALIWTSGVIGRRIDGFPETAFGLGRRLHVDARMLVKGTRNVFAIGDIALNTAQPEYPDGHPQLAQAAIQQGKYLAKIFRSTVAVENAAPFRYREKGAMAIISKYNAVADLPRLHFKGFAAWLLWLFIHLIPIAGFRNKLSLALNWAWAFVTDNPTLRLIIRPQDTRAQTADNTKAKSPANEQTPKVKTKA